MLFDYCRAQADTGAGDAVPIDLSMLGKGRKDKKAKGDFKGKGKGKKDENNKDDKDKDKDKKGKGKGKNNVKAKYLAGNCLQCKGWVHMKIVGGTRMQRARRALHLWRLRLRQLRAQRRKHRSLEC